MTIDQELQAALDVEPSPEFVARVRTYIANEPAPGTWRLWWLLPAIAIPAAVIVAVSLRTVVIQENGSRLLRARNLAEIVVPVGSVPTAIRHETTKSRNHEKPKARSGEAPVNEPLVVIDAAEAATLRRLMFGPPLAIEKPYVGTTLAAIEIAPISIEPLPTGSEGVRQ